MEDEKTQEKKNTGKDKNTNISHRANTNLFKPHKITETKSIEVDFDSVSVASFSSATVTSQSSNSKIVFRRKSFSAKKQKARLDGFCSPSPPTSTCGLDSETGRSCTEGEGGGGHITQEHSTEGHNSDHSSTLRVRTSSELAINTVTARLLMKTLVDFFSDFTIFVDNFFVLFSKRGVIERGRDVTRGNKVSFENKAPVVKSKSVDSHAILSDITKKPSSKNGRSASLTRKAYASELGGIMKR